LPFAGSPFCRQIFQLGMVQGLLPGIGQEPVEDTGKMLKMETRGGYPARTFPKQGVGKSSHKGIYLFAGLKKGMGNWL
jgi:hypothetical protein